MSKHLRALHCYDAWSEPAIKRRMFMMRNERRIPVDTNLQSHNPATGEWNDSLTGDYLWTRANYGEAVPDAMTPCTWSVAQLTLDDVETSIGPYRVYGNICGRLYKNLSMDASFVAPFGLNPKSFLKWSEDAFGRVPDDMEVPIIHLSLWYMLRVVPPVAIRGLLRMRANLKRLPEFLATAPERCEKLRARIEAAASPEELVALWNTDVAPFFHETCHMLEAGANQSGGDIVITRHNLQKLVGNEDADALLTGLGTGSSPLASLGLLLGLTQLANGEIDRATFVRKFGHRGPHEAELSIPRPAEDPDWIEKQLAGLRQTKEDVNALFARQETARRAAWDRLRVRYPNKVVALRRQIDHWGAISRDREAARSEVVRAQWVVRSFFQRAGALMGLGDDVFFVSIDEVLAALGGDKTSLVHIPARRTTYDRYCALPCYPVLIRGPFDPFQWAADPQRRSDVFEARPSIQMPSSGSITGFPGAPGVVEGRAHVILSAEDCDQLQAGEILVTTVANVGWTPLFPRSTAIVTDVGAPLSHAAIVARELGIPAVVGCGNATMRVHTGDWVRVDGGQGTVQVLRTTDALT